MKSKSTKKALTTSIISILLCLAMFIGSTFAWFTDTASTSVNKIEAGTLKVQLLKGDSDEELGEGPLKWVAADSRSQDSIFWEPGASYNLESFRIKNNGNLALKYKIAISDVEGDTKLLDAIDFTVKVGDGTAISLDDLDGNLDANTATEKITITGTMKTTAGNEYQKLSINSIAIKVTATQDTVESDSTGNQYDKNAIYPVYTVKYVETKVEDSKTKVKTAVTINSEQKTSVNGADVSVATANIPEDVVLNNNVSNIELVVEDSVDTNNIAITSDQAKKTLEVKLVGVNEDNTVPVTVSYYIEKGLTGLKLYHNTTKMTAADSESAVNGDQQYYYDCTTGKLTFKSATFSPFTYVYDTTVATAAELAAVTDEKAKTVTISSAKLLAGFARSVNNGNSYDGYTVTLTQNIDLEGREWTPIGNGTRSGASFSGNHFAGTFDGNKKTISNVNNSLFGIVTGTVKNVNIKASINNTTSDSVGAVAGILKGGTISDVEVSGSVIATEATGGIVGRVLAEGTVSNCTNTATVESTNDGEAAGGIVGKAYYTIADKEMNITDCKNTGTIKGKYAAGGIAGFSAANVKNCVNSGKIEMTGNSANSVGGIIGEQNNYGTISGNKNTVDITAKGSVGGIIGWIRYQTNSTAYANNMTIVVSGNENSGNISGTGSGTGGIVGLAYNQAKVTGNKNTATTISGGTFAAGIVGGLQFNNKNLDMNESVRFIVTGNTSTTTLDNISVSGSCKDLFAYNNDSGNTSFADISNNTTK